MLSTGELTSCAMALGGRIRAAREHVGWDQSTLAKKSGVPQPTLSALETRDSDRSSYAEQLIRALPAEKVSHDWIRTGRGSVAARDPQVEYAGRPSAVRAVPVVGTAKMGDQGYYDELSPVPGAGDGYIDIHTRDQNAYALRLRGDSMSPAIRDGWYVVIEPNAAPAVGEYVLLKMRDGRKMIKELLYQRVDSVAVISVNGGERLTIMLDELEGLQAVGAVVPPSKWRPD
jgi:phage repressor protein C with HTH and peptisase S24 domain